MTTSAVASATPIPEDAWCRLSRPPILFPNAMPSDLRCVYDQDGNGLDDEVEMEIARCVAPELRFDTHERWTRINGLFKPCSPYDSSSHVEGCQTRAQWLADGHSFSPEQVTEPHALFSIVRTGPSELAVNYTVLWSWDGGFVEEGGIGCEDEHHGDAQGVLETVTLMPPANGSSWAVRVTSAYTSTNPELSGTHPVVYCSAGKHHFFNTRPPAPNHAEVTFDIHCIDPVDGDGLLIIPGQTGNARLGHVPAWPGYGLAKLTQPQNGQWTNVCALAAGTSTLMTGDFQVNRLDNLGFPGATVASDSFYDADSPIPIFSGETDADGDGNRERVQVRYVYNSQTPEDYLIELDPATDICPLTADTGLKDSDGDGLFGPCDPEPLFRNLYVAGGDATRPAYSSQQASKAHAWVTTTGSSHGAGFLDRDGDGYVEGEDMCPNVASGVAYSHGRNGNTNRWGEEINFPRADNAFWTGGVAQAEDLIKTLGAYYRSNSCDPYPTTALSWKPPQLPGTNNNVCTFHQKKTVGVPHTPPPTLSTSVGISDNDPASAANSWDPRTYNLQGYRCKCSGSNCMSDSNNPCYSINAVAADGFSPAGSGWRPIEQQGCTKGPDGFCAARKTSIKPREVMPASEFKWDWPLEWTKSQQGGFIDKHFASGDCTNSLQTFDTSDNADPGAPSTHTVSYLSCGQYVLWSRIEKGETLGQAPGTLFQKAADQPPFIHYAEPEKLSLGETQNLSSLESFASSRLRSDFAGPQSLHTGGSKTYTVLSGGCYDPGPVSLSYLSLLWLVDPCPTCPPSFQDPGDIYEVSATFGPRVTDRIFPRRSLDRGYARLELDPTAPAWVRTSAGVSAPLATPGDSGVTGSRVLFVETGVSQPRWALLRATGENSTLRTFVVASEGQLTKPLASTVELVGDALGQTAALVDRGTGRVVAFESGFGQWTEAPSFVMSSSLATASLLLTGPRLMAAYPDARGTRTEVQYIDILGTGLSTELLALPPRRGARLLLASDRRTVLSVGGRDARNVMHDDVWTLNLDNGTTRVSQRWADTAQAASFEPARSVLVGSPVEERLQGWRAPGGAIASLRSAARDERGWRELDGLGQPIESACAPSDTAAGMLCPITTDWSSQPGERACVQGTQPGACQGSAGAVRWASTLPTRTTSVAAGFESVWRLTGSAIELWTATEASVPTLLAQATVPTSSTEVVARGNEALVLATDGVRGVRRTSGGISVSAVTAVCGRPLHATSLGDGRWLVVTTLGHSVVSTADGAAPVWTTSMQLQATGAGQVTLKPTTSAALTQCQRDDTALTSTQVTALRSSTALAAGDAARVIASWASAAFWLNLQNPAAPGVQSYVALSGSLTSWRMDARSGRLYGIRTLSNGALEPVTLDARSSLSVGPAHALLDWVRRSDHGNVQALLRSDGSVNVAWGVR